MRNQLLYLGLTPAGKLTNNTNVSLDQFGDLYHGTDQPDLTHIDYRSTSKPVWDMSKHFNYATSHLGTAISWAAHANDPRHSDSPKSLYVYKVTPTEGHWMVDNNIHGGRVTPEHLLSLQNTHQDEYNFTAPSFKFSHPLKAQLVYAREGKMNLRESDGEFDGPWNKKLFEGLENNPSFS